jgi:hypothetical protein
MGAIARKVTSIAVGRYRSQLNAFDMGALEGIDPS